MAGGHLVVGLVCSYFGRTRLARRINPILISGAHFFFFFIGANPGWPGSSTLVQEHYTIIIHFVDIVTYIYHDYIYVR